MSVKIEDLKNIIILTPDLNEEKGGKRTGLQDLRDQINQYLNDKRFRLVIDLSNIKFLNSTEIGALVGIVRAVMNKKAALVLCGIDLRLAETLAMVNLLGIIAIRNTREEAELAVSKATLNHETMKKLIAGNPTIEQVRQWWDSVLKYKSQEIISIPAEIRQKKKATLQTPERTSPQQGNTNAYLVPPPPPLSSVDTDWLEVLKLVRAARKLCEKHSLEFDGDLTFNDFISRMAKQLANDNS
jgi:anti-anti-sigma factor